MFGSCVDCNMRCGLSPVECNREKYMGTPGVPFNFILFPHQKAPVSQGFDFKFISVLLSTKHCCLVICFWQCASKVEHIDTEEVCNDLHQCI